MDYDTRNCRELLKPICLYGAKAETSDGMAYGETKAYDASDSCVLSVRAMGNQAGKPIQEPSTTIMGGTL